MYALDYALKFNLPRVARAGLIELALLQDAGDAFMSCRQVAQRAGLSEMEVRKSLDLLESRGLIDDRREVPGCHRPDVARL